MLITTSLNTAVISNFSQIWAEYRSASRTLYLVTVQDLWSSHWDINLPLLPNSSHSNAKVIKHNLVRWLFRPLIVGEVPQIPFYLHCTSLIVIGTSNLQLQREKYIWYTVCTYLVCFTKNFPVPLQCPKMSDWLQCLKRLTEYIERFKPKTQQIHDLPWVRHQICLLKLAITGFSQVSPIRRKSHLCVSYMFKNCDT